MIGPLWLVLACPYRKPKTLVWKCEPGDALSDVQSLQTATAWKQNWKTFTGDARPLTCSNISISGR
jgi:hypothetical protein